MSNLSQHLLLYHQYVVDISCCDWPHSFVSSQCECSYTILSAVVVVTCLLNSLTCKLVDWFLTGDLTIAADRVDV